MLSSGALQFFFTDEQRNSIASALGEGPSSIVDAGDAVDVIENENRIYLAWQAKAKALPSAERIEERRKEDDRARARVIDGIRRARGVNPQLVDQACADPESLTVRSLIDMVTSGQISPREFEAAVAARFITAGKLRMETLDTWLSGDGHRHRRSLFEGVVRVWLRHHRLTLGQLTISEGTKGAGGAFLRFVQTSTPALQMTGESIGDRQVCSVIREIKASPSKGLQLDLGMIDSQA